MAGERIITALMASALSATACATAQASTGYFFRVRSVAVQPITPAFSFSGAVPSTARMGRAYRFDLRTLLASDQQDKVAWQVTGLPSWATVDATGVISGTAPQAMGTTDIQVVATRDGNTASSTFALRVSDNTLDATKVAVGNLTACAIEPGGSVRCWSKYAYTLGNGSTTGSLVPSSPAIASGATDIAIGTGHACAILSGGRLDCWGESNTVGQLGFAGTSDGRPGTAIASGVTKVAISDNTTCAVVSGDLKCWGANSNGFLATGDKDPVRQVPTKPLLTGGVTDVSLTSNRICAVQSGALKCWGEGVQGALGSGNNNSTTSPGTAQIASGVVDVATTPEHARCSPTDG